MALNSGLTAGLTAGLTQGLTKSAGWSPADLASGVIWWDASDSDNYTESGGKITAMSDKIGSYDIDQSNGSYQPASGGSINGVHAFTHVSASLHALNTTQNLAGRDAAGDIICSAVFQPADTAKRYYVTYNSVLFRLANEGIQDRTGQNKNILTLTRGTSPTLVTGRLADTTTECWQDGVAETPLTFADVAGNTATYVEWSANTSSGLEGDIGEIVMYRDISEREAVESYLADKWGISI